jgi:hypothetical protein
MGRKIKISMAAIKKFRLRQAWDWLKSRQAAVDKVRAFSERAMSTFNSQETKRKKK